MSPSTTLATLNYTTPLPPSIKAYQWIDSPPSGTPKTNLTSDPHSALITDVRSLPLAERPTLEQNGAEFLFGERAVQKGCGGSFSKEWNWGEEEDVKKGYYGEVEELLKRVTGCKRVVIFDHTVRRTAKIDGEEDSPKNRHPVPAVHIDQTPKAGFARLHKHLDPAEITAALAHRSQLINVWRPIGNQETTTVEDWPLAIADANTVKDADKIPCDLISNAYPTGETYRVLHSDAHKWYYLAHQTPREYILIKCFDSTRPDKIVPHTAFENKDAKAGAPGRESVEVRCLVLYDE